MPVTKIEDVIVPEIFNPYMIQKAVEKNAFLQSGIATPDPSIVLGHGGRTINIPHWKNLSGTAEVLSDTTGLTVNKVDTFADVAAIHARGVAYGFNGLAALLAGDDPAGVIATKLADNWNTEIQKILSATLDGIFGLEAMAGSVLDKSTAVLDSDTMVDAMFLLGDNFQNITAIAMNSAVLAKLQKLDLLDKNVMPSQTGIPIPSYMGKRIIVDDAIAPSTGNVFPIYFFGAGAFAYNENVDFATIKHDEDILEDNTYIASRRSFTLHPRGVAWIGTPAGATPSNTELATATNWRLVDERKNVSISKLLVKVV